MHRTYYKDGAILRDEVALDGLFLALDNLHNIHFDLCLKDKDLEDQNYWNTVQLPT